MSQQYPQDPGPGRQQPPWDYSQEPQNYSQHEYYSPHVHPNAQQHVPEQWQGNSPYGQPQPPFAPRKRRWPAIAGWTAGAVALLAISIGATVVLRHHNAAAAKPLTCKQQYANWKNGPAHAQALKMDSAGKALDAAGKSEDIKMMLSALKAIGAGAAVLEAYPMPACADPKGYWPQVLADMKAAGDNADGASGLSGLLLAEAPLEKIKPLEAKMDAELAKTAGYKAP